jgi:Ni,Fe-hydrogenase III small subunit
MANWVLKGLRTGVRTSDYPREEERARGVTPGRPRGTALPTAEEAVSLASLCPTEAIQREGSAVVIDEERCVHCFRCSRDASSPVEWEETYEWASLEPEIKDARRTLDRTFGRSLHIRFVDAGACGACVSEARQLNNPDYNMHRLGFFTTPTPRNADILLVAGPLSDAMRLPLRKTFEAMPEPKRVIAIGTCAASGGIFAPSFATAGGISEVIPVDVVVPGCPPPPLAILHALLVVVGRKPPATSVSKAPIFLAEQGA